MRVIEAVRLTAAALRTSGAESEAELSSCLESVGLGPASTRRLVSFVPIGVGQELLRRLGTIPSTHYALPDGTRCALTEDPIFAAALAYARREADRDDYAKAAVWSAEVNAVNQAMHDGSVAADVVLTDIRFVEAPPALDDALNEIFATLDLDSWGRELCAAHGATRLPLECEIFPRVVKLNQVQLQLDVRARTPHGTICESFAAMGTSLGEAARHAFDRFTRGSAHVLFATFVDPALGADQVEWEQWDRFRSCMGALITQSNEPIDTSFYAGFLDALRVLTRTLPPRSHSIRVYQGRLRDEILASEVLLNNEPWHEAESLLRSAHWPRHDGFYSLRHFMVLESLSAS